MSSQQEEDRIVDSLGVVMRGNLRANAGKVHWKNNPGETRQQTLRRFLKLARREMDEIEAVLDAGGSGRRVRSECADAANFLAMMADIAVDDSDDYRGES